MKRTHFLFYRQDCGQRHATITISSLYQPMKDIRYWVSKVLTPEQSEVEKKPEPKHSVTEKMKFLQEQSSNQPEQKTPQQKKQNMEL